MTRKELQQFLEYMKISNPYPEDIFVFDAGKAARCGYYAAMYLAELYFESAMEKEAT
jgi:hypothetical protein